MKEALSAKGEASLGIGSPAAALGAERLVALGVERLAALEAERLTALLGFRGPGSRDTAREIPRDRDLR